MKDNIIKIDNSLTVEDVEKLEKKLFTAGLNTRLGVGNDRYYIKELVEDLISTQKKLLLVIQNKEDFKKKIIRFVNSRIRSHNVEGTPEFYCGYQKAWEDIKRIIEHMN